jgi:hypothetical protein
MYAKEAQTTVARHEVKTLAFYGSRRPGRGAHGRHCDPQDEAAEQESKSGLAMFGDKFSE